MAHQDLVFKTKGETNLNPENHKDNGINNHNLYS